MMIVRLSGHPLVQDSLNDEGQVLRKLKPKIPDHSDAHPVAENMKLRKDQGSGSGDCLIHTQSKEELL